MTKQTKWTTESFWEEGLTVVGTAKERGDAFIDALTKASALGVVNLAVGYGIAMGEFVGGGPVKPLHIVAVKINDKIHAFSTEEASHMADCIEDAMNTYPEDCFAKLAEALVDSFRAAVEKTGEVDLKPWRVQ